MKYNHNNIAFILWLWAIGVAVSAAAKTTNSQQSKSQPPQDKIRHVVVMMLENRSFDHMLGWYQRINPKVEGLVDPKVIHADLVDEETGNVCLSLDKDPTGVDPTGVDPTGVDPTGVDPTGDPRPTKPRSRLCVNDNAADVCADDPCHTQECTTRQIYGFDKPEDGTDPPEATMKGALWDAKVLGQNPTNRISMQKPQDVPVMTALAQDFGLFDRWFSSHPGPTYPNRQFVHTGTANGEFVTGNVPKGGFSQPTLFEKLLAKGYDWKVYYDGFQGMTWIQMLAYFNTPEALVRTHDMDQFYGDAASGNLPTYVFLEPRIFLNTSDTGPSRGLPNHQHPVASVKEGERWYKNVYEALRNGPSWNHTLLVVTYDEHGGFFDHVPPPQAGVPRPDDVVAANGFRFDRLGIRIPTLVVSPWIPKGTLIQEPTPKQKPTLSSQWDLTSIPATMNQLFGLGDFLTRRDAWAATFGDLFETLDEPRTDCPEKLPAVAPSTDADADGFANAPLDEHQELVLQRLCLANGKDPACGAHVRTQAEAGEFSAALWQSFRSSRRDNPKTASAVVS